MTHKIPSNERPRVPVSPLPGTQSRRVTRQVTARPQNVPEYWCHLSPTPSPRRTARQVTARPQSVPEHRCHLSPTPSPPSGRTSGHGPSSERLTSDCGGAPRGPGMSEGVDVSTQGRLRQRPVALRLRPRGSLRTRGRGPVPTGSSSSRNVGVSVPLHPCPQFSPTSHRNAGVLSIPDFGRRARTVCAHPGGDV